jgi:hypothetical protein
MNEISWFQTLLFRMGHSLCERYVEDAAAALAAREAGAPAHVDSP